jgi:hypothetical protein
MSELPPPISPAIAFSPEDRIRTLAEVFGEDWANDFQDPVVFRSYCFYSPAAKQFYKREFPLVSRTLFAESVYRRRPLYDQALLDSFIVAAAKKLSDVQAMIGVQCLRLVKLCESNGQLTDASFLHPQQLLVPIIAAHATSYLRCLQRLDELYHLSGSATLNGVIDGNQRKTVELLCRKAVRSFSAMLRNEIVKLRKESLRMRTVAGLSDLELDQVEGAQAQAIERFDQAAQEEELSDRGMTAGIAEIAASTLGTTTPDLKRAVGVS